MVTRLLDWWHWRFCRNIECARACCRPLPHDEVEPVEICFRHGYVFIVQGEQTTRVRFH